MKIRKGLYLISFVAVLFSISGCFTYVAWLDKEYYRERVSTVLVSQDRSKLAVITDQYHYLFDAPEVLAKTLGADYFTFVDGRFTEFEVSTNGEITGDFVLSISRHAAGKYFSQAVTDGYRLHGNNGHAVYKDRLTGIRYLANGVNPYHASYKLQQEISITISEKRSVGEFASNVLVTPFTLALDGTLTLISAPYLAVVVTASAFCWVTECND